MGDDLKWIKVNISEIEILFGSQLWFWLVIGEAKRGVTISRPATSIYYSTGQSSFKFTIQIDQFSLSLSLLLSLLLRRKLLRQIYSNISLFIVLVVCVGLG